LEKEANMRGKRDIEKYKIWKEIKDWA